jgi:hypothetical protein
MSSDSSQAATQAMQTDKLNAGRYYGIAIPGLQAQMGDINKSLNLGEPEYLKQAYQGQRTGLTEGLAAQGGAAQAQQMRGSKAAMSGGNQFASMNPADVGAQLANALYGSKFQEGQAGINQQFNLMSMGLGGSGTAGNAAVGASQQQLQAIGYMPNYNSTLANVAGAAAGGASIYGAYRNWSAGQQGGFPSIGPTGGYTDPYSVNPYQTTGNIGGG